MKLFLCLSSPWFPANGVDRKKRSIFRHGWESKITRAAQTIYVTSATILFLCVFCLLNVPFNFSKRLQDTVNELKTTKDKLDAEKNKLTAELNKATSDLSAAESKVSEAEKAKASVEGQLDLTKEELKKTKEAVEQVKKELEVEKRGSAEAVRLKQDLEKSEEKGTKLEKQV